MNPLASIDGKASVTSLDRFLSQFPTGKIPKQSPYAGKQFVCRRGLDMRTTTYSDEFTWEDVYSGHRDLASLLEFVREETRTKRRQGGRPTAAADDYDADLDTSHRDHGGEHFTPRGAKNKR